MSATSLEIKQERELALDKDEESAEDDETLDVSAYSVRIQGMIPSADHSRHLQQPVPYLHVKVLIVRHRLFD
jgi:hypothetical protein